MTLVYPGILYPFSDGSGGYVVEFPDLPGCVTEGKHLEEALMMGNDAASGWILDEMEEGNKLPEPTDYRDVQFREGGIVNLFALDMDSYAEKYGEKSVRKNLTIPAWLNTYAEKNNINFSQVLQEALFKMSQAN
ncbi:MAG: type II toxin-antitoxin system HicB family antitoxin [Lachnospiraceae bacterium]|nr:type II toxin-antitoxin system HicB family antitoxin [Lachnospiraceae bacterium]